MTPTYLNAVCDQLKSAARDGNGAAAASVLRQVAVRHPELAEQITNRLLVVGLRRLATTTH